jgi:hypothetical protein
LSQVVVICRKSSQPYIRDLVGEGVAGDAGAADLFSPLSAAAVGTKNWAFTRRSSVPHTDKGSESVFLAFEGRTISGGKTSIPAGIEAKNTGSGT